MDRENADFNELIGDEYAIDEEEFREEIELGEEELKAMKFTRYNQLWRLWKEYIDYRLIGNEELKRVLFHVVIGVILTHKDYSYYEAPYKRSTRMHTFIIQDSGNGKSVAMKAVCDLIDYLKIPYRWTIKDNEASVIGSVFIDERSKKAIQREGILSTALLLTYDEGSVLLKKSGFMDVLTDAFQGAMDEPGRVAKGMKLGNIDYYTRCTLLAGSYMFDEFETALFEKGFLQRMFVFNANYTEVEKKNTRHGVFLLKGRTDVKRMKEVMELIKRLISEIPKPEDNVVLFDKDDIEQFFYVLEEFRDENIASSYTMKKQKVLDTFANRMSVLIDKIAAQRAIVDGRRIVNLEDMQEGLKLVNYHVKSLHQIFSLLPDVIKRDFEGNRENEIKRMIQENGNVMSKKELLMKLQIKFSTGEWAFGSGKTLNYLNDLIKKGVIKENQGRKKDITLYIA